MKRFTYKKLREWELEHGESFLDYFGDQTMPDIEPLVLHLEAKFPSENWREDPDMGIMGIVGVVEGDFDNDEWHVERAFIDILTDEQSNSLRKEVKEYDE